MPRSTDLHGFNHCERLETCIKRIKELHADAELCIITGDLSNSGDPEAYHGFCEILLQLPMSYHILSGNHDHRDIFAEIFQKFHLTSMVLCNKC